MGGVARPCGIDRPLLEGVARNASKNWRYFDNAVQLISEDPYRLARDIRGIGFRTADAIAMKLGIEKTAMIRARAGISYALTESLDEMGIVACRAMN